MGKVGHGLDSPPSLEKKCLCGKSAKLVSGFAAGTADSADSHAMILALSGTGGKKKALITCIVIAEAAAEEKNTASTLLQSASRERLFKIGQVGPSCCICVQQRW